MSGYTAEAVNALTLGKSLNIVLFDGRDIDTAIVHGNGFKNVIKLKLRKAAEEGVIYFPTVGELVTANETEPVEIDHLRFDRATGGIFPTQSVVPATADLLIVCEGDIDRIVIANLAKQILDSVSSTRSVQILTSVGKIAIPRVANALWNDSLPNPQVLIVVDGDNDPAGTFEMLAKGLQFTNWISAIPNPSIESWLGLDHRASMHWNPENRVEKVRQRVNQLDIYALRSKDEQFAKFYDAILGL